MKRKSMHISGSQVIGNIVQGDVQGDIEANIQPASEIQLNSNIFNSEKPITLAEAAKEIQQLLKQLESTNPTATEAEKISYVNNETTPNFKRRAVGALQAGGEAAIEEFLDNPYINVGKAIVKGWIKPE